VNLPLDGAACNEDGAASPLRRSKPGLLPRSVTGGLAEPVLRRALDHIDAHLHEGITVQNLAALVQLSVPHFSRAFSRSTGISPHRYLMRLRLQHATCLLRNTQRTASEIALLVGFSDQSHFIRCFVRLTGKTPRVYRREREQSV
jgi:AraC family transcriptional regulator